MFLQSGRPAGHRAENMARERRGDSRVPKHHSGMRGSPRGRVARSIDVVRPAAFEDILRANCKASRRGCGMQTERGRDSTYPAIVEMLLETTEQLKALRRGNTGAYNEGGERRSGSGGRAAQTVEGEQRDNPADTRSE